MGSRATAGGQHLQVLRYGRLRERQLADEVAADTLVAGGEQLDDAEPRRVRDRAQHRDGPLLVRGLLECLHIGNLR